MGNSYNHALIIVFIITGSTAITINVTITSPTELPTLGLSYFLVCTVTGADNHTVDITYQWFKEARETVAQVGMDSSRLDLQSLSLSDVGLYTCVVTVSTTLLSENVQSTSMAVELIFPGELVYS